jgi:DNA end-binding protein Ku
MHFADEIREAEGMPEGKVEIKEDELKLTQQLIESMGQASFDASKFPDTYSKAVQEMIERKLEGKKVEGGKAAPRRATNVLDLMSRLKASLEETEHSEKKKTSKKSKPAAKSTSKKSTAKKSREKEALKKAA